MNGQHTSPHLLPGIVRGMRALGPPVSDSNWLAFTNYGDNASSCLLFMFDGRRRSPRAVAKITDDAAMSRREYRNQVAAHELAPHYVPRPLGTFEIGALTVVCTEVVGGRHLTSSRDQFRNFARIAQCLLSLHRAGARAATTLARAQLAAVYDKFVALSGDRRLRDYAEECRRELMGGTVSLPSIAQHGDFRYMNVLIDKRSVGILDWEYYGVGNMPCYDLMCLLLDAFFCESPQQPCDAVAAKKFARLVRDAVQHYFDALHIPLALAQPLLEWTLFQQFVYSVERGESSQQKFLDRIVLYRDDVSHSREVLTTLLAQGGANHA